MAVVRYFTTQCQYSPHSQAVQVNRWHGRAYISEKSLSGVKPGGLQRQVRIGMLDFLHVAATMDPTRGLLPMNTLLALNRANLH